MTTRKPVLSGFCNPNNDLASHRRCIEHPRPSGGPCPCTRPGCPCNPETDMPEGGWHVAAAAALDAAETEPPLAFVPDPGWSGDPFENLTIEQAVDTFRAAATLLNVAAKAELPGGVEGIRLLDRIRAAINEARYVDSALVTKIYLTAEHGQTEVEGIGQVKIYRTRDRKAWDVRSVVGAILDQHMAERSGELPNDVWEIAEWILEVLPGGEPRLTPLRSLGLDPEAFHTSTPGNPTVQLPPR